MTNQLEEIIKKIFEEAWHESLSIKSKDEEKNCDCLYGYFLENIRTTYPAYAKELMEKCLPAEKDGVNAYDTCVEHDYVGISCLKCSGFNSAIVEMRKNINKEIIVED